MKPGKGLLISFEGIDFSGKSVQSELLYKKIKESYTVKNCPVYLFREPGGSKISELIREILLDRSLTMMNSYTELLLYSAARSQLIVEKIIPELNRGSIVICDRFYDSTVAYQGYGRSIELDKIKMANHIATHGVKPKITLIIDVEPQMAADRQRKAGFDRDRLENEKLSFHQKVRAGYLQLAVDEPDRVKIINGNDKIEEISKKIWQLIKTDLKKNF